MRGISVLYRGNYRVLYYIVSQFYDRKIFIKKKKENRKKNIQHPCRAYKARAREELGQQLAGRTKAHASMAVQVAPHCSSVLAKSLSR